MTKGSERQYILKILEDIRTKELFASKVIDDYFYVYDFDKQQRSFISRVVYGTIEHRIYIDYVINQVSKIKVNKMKPVIRQILRMSVYQLLFMDKVPSHAIINEAVKITKKRKFYQLSGFVNGVLRSVDREKDMIGKGIEGLDSHKKLSIKYSVNEELIRLLSQQYSTEVLTGFFEDSLLVKDTCLRTNTLQTDVNGLMKELSKYGQVEEGHVLEDSLYFSGYDRLDEVKPFVEGKCQVQDESSSLVGIVADPKDGQTVMDVCAAPGGKTTHLATLLKGSGKVISCDVSESKLSKISENIDRLNLKNIEPLMMDGTVFNQEYSGKVDVVVADVPCSGLGILRNKPDIKYNMTVNKMKDLVSIQRDIMKNVSSYVKPGGTFVYSTCTINKEENIEQVQWFLEKNSEFDLVDVESVLSDKLSVESMEKVKPYISDGCLQLMTNKTLTDGFFIAKMVRKG